MATNDKVQNYSAELTAEVVARYKAGEAVAEIAKAVGKSTRSVIAKLSREGAYVSKAKAKGEKQVHKADLIARISVLTGVDEETLASLEKANREALEVIVAGLGG